MDLTSAEMVRPKASDANLRSALAFSDVVTVEAESGIQSSDFTVARKGRQSIFAAFSLCCPDLVRDSKEKRPQNRHGVAWIELDKALKSRGLKPLRRRDRIGGSVRWGSKVAICNTYYVRQS